MLVSYLGENIRKRLENNWIGKLYGRLSPTPFLSCFVLTRDARFAGQRADLSLIQAAISVLAAHAPVPRGDVPMRAPGHRTGQGPQNHDPGLVERSRAQSWGSAGPTRLTAPGMGTKGRGQSSLEPSTGLCL